MGVTNTPNIGLYKPDETELAGNWDDTGGLCELNNIIIEAKTNIPLTSYTPTFVGSTTNPNVGAGFIVGEYCLVQGFVWGNFNIQFLDPGTAPGTGAGAYGISLPFAADTSFHSVGTSLSDVPGAASCIGEGHFIDNTVALSGTAALDIVAVAGTTYARFITETFVGKTAAFFTPGMPMSFATNDKLTGQFFYKKV